MLLILEQPTLAELTITQLGLITFQPLIFTAALKGLVALIRFFSYPLPLSVFIPPIPCPLIFALPTPFVFFLLLLVLFPVSPIFRFSLSPLIIFFFPGNYLQENTSAKASASSKSLLSTGTLFITCMYGACINTSFLKSSP